MILGPELWNSLLSDLNGHWEPDPTTGPPDFEYVATDTRTLHAGSESMSRTLFIALRGARHDGHDHIQNAASMGVRGFIVAKDWRGEVPGGVVMRVPDTLLALQALGKAARQSRSARVIGITGSNGKTTVKEWAAALAGDDLNISRSPGSWNSQVGVPLTLWGLDGRAEVHCVEAGISKPGEMTRLAAMIQPEIGVMTHFGDAHDAHFPNRLDKAREKVKLFANCDSIILGTDDAHVLQALDEAGLGDRCISWRLPDDGGDKANIHARLHFDQVITGSGRTTLSGAWGRQKVQWCLPFEDKAHIANALTSALLMLELGVPPENLSNRLSDLKALGMRLEHLGGLGGGTIINDTWNHDLDGLTTALDALDRLPDDKPKAVVMSDLIPFDGNDTAQMDRLRHALGQRKVDRWITVGDQLALGIPGIPKDTIVHHATTEALLESTTLDALQGWHVLVKGARPFRFERVARSLEANPHTTVFDLDLGRLAHNLEKHRERYGLPIMGMVKAFSYGAGDAVAVELDRLGISRLAVAFPEEGIALRKRGVQCPIMVLNADPQRYGDLLTWWLEPEVHRIEHFELWHRSVSSHPKQKKCSVGVHLKVETGMHRLGLGPEEWHTSGARLAQLGIPIISVYSHLSAADDPASDEHTHQQIQRYQTACDNIAQGWMESAQADEPPKFLRHLANTAGAARFPEARFDLIRVGLGLYGLDASGTLRDLLPIGKYHTRVSHLHRVQAGEPVGYGADDVSTKDRMIATLPVGYADGLPRSAGRGNASLSVLGKACPTVGPICMDGCMLDVTGLEVETGTPVEIFGDDAPIEALAEAVDSIPYELLCRIPQRVRRRHLRT